MRIAFTRTLAELAGADRRIILLTGDLGYTVLEPFSERYPDRFLNVGVAEQNMIGLATGLAEAGFIPFVYSIVTFATLRAYEFIRNGPILHQLPVRIVGVGGGFEYGSAGNTHHGLEDIAIMRCQPGLTVIAPADHEQTRTALLKTWDLPGPVYYRLGKNDPPTVPGLNGRFELGSLQVIREGKELVFISTGSVAHEVATAVEALADRGISCAFAIASCVSPPPTEELFQLLATSPLVFTVEAHSVNGGLGSMVSEVIAERRMPCRVVRCGVRQPPQGITGSPSFMHHRHGISSEALVEAALRQLGGSEVARGRFG